MQRLLAHFRDLLLATLLCSCASVGSQGVPITGARGGAISANRCGMCAGAGVHGLKRRQAWVVPGSEIKRQNDSICQIEEVCIITNPRLGLIVAGQCHGGPDGQRYELPKGLERPEVRVDGEELVVLFGEPDPAELRSPWHTGFRRVDGFSRRVDLSKTNLPSTNVVTIRVRFRSWSLNQVSSEFDECRSKPESADDVKGAWTSMLNMADVSEASVVVERSSLEKVTCPDSEAAEGM